MNLIDILILVSALVFLLLLWTVAGVRHLKHLRRSVAGQWESVNESLRKRQDLIPNLIETLRGCVDGQEEFIEKFVGDRERAAREYDVGARKMEYEHELSADINKVMELAGTGGAAGATASTLARDTNFLELRKEIEDLEKNIEEKTRKYNEMVRYYNKHRRFVLLRPLAAVFNYGVERIFEVES